MIFKKRTQVFSTSATSSTPIKISTITMEETGTIYAVKVNMYVVNFVGVKNNIHRVRTGVVCQRPNAAIVDPGVNNEIDTMKGFMLPTIFTHNLGTGDIAHNGVEFIREKFRFRRVCDKNEEVNLFGRVVVMNGATETHNFYGDWEIIIRVR